MRSPETPSWRRLGSRGEIGTIQIGDTRRHYTLLDEEGQVTGQVVGDLGVKQFSVTGAEGERYARIRKTFAGVGKEFFTDADHYSLTFTGPVSARVRTLRVTVLSTMLADTKGVGEWGFAALVEADGHRVLFDTGHLAFAVAEGLVSNSQYAR